LIEKRRGGPSLVFYRDEDAGDNNTLLSWAEENGTEDKVFETNQKKPSIRVTNRPTRTEEP